MKDDRSSTAAEAGASAVPSPSSETLTERQRRVLEVIRDSVTERGYPPSIREIGGDAVGGLTSTSSVAHQLRTLERKGFLRRDPNRPRAVDVRGLDEVAADTAIASVSKHSGEYNSADRCQSRRSSPPSWAASLPADRSSPRKLWRMCFHSPPASSSAKVRSSCSRLSVSR